ncbi:cob(I)yrinic acid a,c-diamide adenosyltransferase [Candidatus Nomurabacteria bacterium]|nr:cob(I)yrinic acid a,c-diamide adenosyltransferase [Candidatus Nomurabacteria bacterium]MCB9819265.1 cob(I)yrinic acid a,c-diamide adenosyltransferase [Candidatus Nomurabacteria bacterium]
MLYTRNGDKGTSGLFGTKERLSKDSPVFEALGTVDELNSLLGICRARFAKIKDERISSEILKVQECLFIVQAELAGVHKSLEQSHIDSLEQTIEDFEGEIVNPHSFVIPGATELSALFDYARAVSRRAERTVITARSGSRVVSPETLAYLNRLSSLLYALARYVAVEESIRELSPSYKNN